MSSVQSISFKAYVPVRYYVKNSETGKYDPVLSKENIKKCHSFVVRNLNGTAKKNKNDSFVNYFKSFDQDYKRNPQVHSVYDRKDPVVHLLTGNDAVTVNEMAKPIGRAKGEAMDRLGHSKSYESASASRQFFYDVKRFIRNSCRQIKQDGKKQFLAVFFEPKYNRNDKFTGFEFLGSKFYPEKY